LLLIGLTGNIGVGKSTVARQLAELGAHVIDADVVYRQLIEPDQPGWRAVVGLFGPVVLAPDRSIDRRQLGEIVFRDPAQLDRLERATHPLVLERIDRMLADARPRVAVHEAIKLIESGAADRCDEVWVVVAPRELQIERLIQSRRLSHDEAALRVDSQSPAAEKIARADVVIENQGDLDQLRARVLEEWRRVEGKLELCKEPSPSPSPRPTRKRVPGTRRGNES
jgi:dephospho-CoA kinase